MKELKKLLAAILVLAMVLSLAACGGGGGNGDDTEKGDTDSSNVGGTDTDNTSAEAGDPVYGGSLVVYLDNLGALTSYEPAVPDFAYYMIWYEQLFTLDWSITDQTFAYLDMNNMTGQIAESYEYDADAMTLTVKIRDDITFQKLDDAYDYYGGRGLTADDVKYSYDRLLGLDGVEQVMTLQNWAESLWMLDSVESDGAYTVTFHFNTNTETAENAFITTLVNIIGPEWDELTEEQQSDWHYACGTGAYILTDCVEGQYMTLVKNENYYDYDERHPENKLPYLDQIQLICVSDSATLQAEFISGELDMVGANEDVFTTSELAQIYTAMNDDEYAVINTLSTNMNLIMKQSNEALTNLNVRKALQYAVDLDTVVSTYFSSDYDNGMYDNWTIPSPFSVETPWALEWSDDLLAEYTTYDVDKALELLEAEGYGDGFEIEMVVSSSGSTELWQIIADYLAAVNVTLTITPADMATMNSMATDKDNGVCSMVNMGNFSMSNTLAYWSSAGSNYRLGHEDTLDGLVAEVNDSTTMDEQTARAQAFEQYILEQHYVLVSGPTQYVTSLVSAKVGGYYGEQFHTGWNCGTVMSRLWSVTGK